MSFKKGDVFHVQNEVLMVLEIDEPRRLMTVNIMGAESSSLEPVREQPGEGEAEVSPAEPTPRGRGRRKRGG